MLRVLTGAGTVVLALLLGLGYAIHLALSGASTSHPTSRKPITETTSGHTSGTPRRDQIAAQPMLPVPDSAAQPTASAPTPGPAVTIPAGTGVAGPALVATGFPHTPEGAIGQLAQIDLAVLQAMSTRTAREIHAAWALPGGVRAEAWWTAAAVEAFRAGTGTNEATESTASVTVEPAAAMVKGTDGPDWVLACVLMEVTAEYRSTAQIAWAHCERMQWVGGRWMVAPGAPPTPAPATWPSTELASRAGWRAWQTDNTSYAEADR